MTDEDTKRYLVRQLEAYKKESSDKHTATRIHLEKQDEKLEQQDAKLDKLLEINIRQDEAAKERERLAERVGKIAALLAKIFAAVAGAVTFLGLAWKGFVWALDFIAKHK